MSDKKEEKKADVGKEPSAPTPPHTPEAQVGPETGKDSVPFKIPGESSLAQRKRLQAAGKLSNDPDTQDIEMESLKVEDKGRELQNSGRNKGTSKHGKLQPEDAITE